MELHFQAQTMMFVPTHTFMSRKGEVCDLGPYDGVCSVQWTMEMEVSTDFIGKACWPQVIIWKIGEKRKKLEEEKSIIIRFVIGHGIMLKNTLNCQQKQRPTLPLLLTCGMLTFISKLMMMFM
ncbi:uncharacterized protein LOC123917621 [Trifolium pratense]|uniref:uncharacterized protein LOC123917621 n=1 Tax=Trifolium pratense TaxID=57577 RepID=UPI001E69466C|nr:uncharacterized protein LOC123917621 [Trifolium pratense]